MTVTTRPPVRWGSELTLPLVTFATAVSLVRAFRDWDALWPLLGIAAAAHLVAFLGRVLRRSALVSTAVGLAVGTVLVALTYYPGSTRAGLPTGATVRQAVDDAHVAFGPFEKLVAPVDSLTGFTVTFAIGLWLMATFADLAAHRMEAPVQAVVLPIVTFVFSSVLLLGRHAALSAGTMVVALALFRLAVRSGRVSAATAAARRPNADGGRPPSGVAPLWASGVVLLTAVVVLGAAVGDRAPAGDDRLLDLRALGRGPSSRTVASPLVSLDSLLGSRSDETLFTVWSDEAHYWRLTALDEFNGRSWSANAKYRDLDQDDPVDSPWGRDVATSTERFVVKMQGLQSDWLPVPYAPVRLDAPVDLRVDESSSSIFVASGERATSIEYAGTAEVADPDLLALQAAPAGRSSELTDFLELPDDFPDDVAEEAEFVTSDLPPFEKAAALERFFLDPERFSYRRDVDYRDSADPLGDFLRTGEGFCQQFATAYAAMARSVGLPSRVAVGFTWGEKQESTEPGPEEWRVKGRYAHAWPEVYLQGVGWVAFEPTPGRGNPDAVDYATASEPAQSGADGGESVGIATTTTSTTVLAGAVPAPTSTTVPVMPPTTAASTSPDAGEERSSAPLVVLACIAALLLGGAAAAGGRVAAVRRRRVRARGDHVPTVDRVATTWRQVNRDLSRVGVHARPAETPTEFAKRAARTMELADLERLGRRESVRRFRREPPSVEDAEEAERIGDEVREVVWSRLDRRQRLLAELDLGRRRD